jgi:hypothetical protein
LSVSEDAKELALQAQAAINAHEQVCAERYAHIHASISRIEGVMKWVGGVIITLILAVLGWSLTQQYNANEAQKRALEDRIELLQGRQPQTTEPSAP